MSVYLLLFITIVTLAILILMVDIFVDKVITYFEYKREQQRLEEAKRYSSFFDSSRAVQR